MKEVFKNQEKNFLLQQGFAEPELACCARYGPLQFQPRIVGTWFLLSVLFQSPVMFALLSSLLFLSAFFPQFNPFEALYNRTLARRPGGSPLGNALPPRRFAQGMAGTMTALIALCLWFHRPLWAQFLQFVMAGALLALLLAGFCLGAVVYFAIRGEWKFAKQTLPWS